MNEHERLVAMNARAYENVKAKVAKDIELSLLNLEDLLAAVPVEVQARMRKHIANIREVLK